MPVQQETYHAYCLHCHASIATARVAPADEATMLDRQKLALLEKFALDHRRETLRDTEDGGLRAHSTRVIPDAVKVAWEAA